MDLDDNENLFFPYSPYESQKHFMQKIFETLQNKKAGIFESPTGTGKSLSLLCGALIYLNNLKSNISQGANSNKNQIKIKKIEEPNWLDNFGADILESTGLNYNNFFTNTHCQKRKHSEFIKSHNNFTQQRFKYDEKIDQEKKMLIDDNCFLNLNQNNINNAKNQKKNQIFYCTRTHSQISQVISEIKKIKIKFRERQPDKEFQFSFTSIGSRKLLCLIKK
jgi:chromosome transmission fidelity protein 1